MKKKKTAIYDTWMSLVDIMLSETSCYKRTNLPQFHLYEVSKIVKFTKLESEMVVSRSWGN